MAWMRDTLVNAIGIIVSFLFAAVSLRSETKTRRIANLLTLTQSHRELWSGLIQRPELKRLLDPSADVSKTPITLEERIQVNLIILHLNSAFEAIKSGLVVKPEGLRKDVGWFFSLPIPRYVWEKMKALQNDDFAAFVERCTEYVPIPVNKKPAKYFSQRCDQSG